MENRRFGIRAKFGLLLLSSMAATAVACAPESVAQPTQDEAALTGTAAADGGAPDAADDAGPAASYTCLAKKDPDRGLGEDALIDINPVAIGGDLAVSVNGNRVYVGTVREVGVLSNADPAQRPEFEAMLGMFHEVSGISGIGSEGLDSVASMKVIGSSRGEDEVYVVQMLDASGKQIGGSFTNGAIAAACLPSL